MTNQESRSKIVVSLIFVGTIIVMMAYSCNKDQHTQTHSNASLPEEHMSVPLIDNDEETVVVYEDAETIIENMEEVNQAVTTLPEVISMTITSNIQDREPVDELSEIDLSLHKIFVHTAIRTEKTDTIYHVYKVDNVEIARVPLFVGESPNWRTWSSKYIDRIWLGNWAVEVESNSGKILSKKQFKVIENLETNEDQNQKEIKEKPIEEEFTTSIDIEQ